MQEPALCCSIPYSSIEVFYCPNKANPCAGWWQRIYLRDCPITKSVIFYNLYEQQKSLPQCTPEINFHPEEQLRNPMFQIFPMTR